MAVSANQRWKKYCAIKGCDCEKELAPLADRSCFFAYPFRPPFNDIAAALSSELGNAGFRMRVPRASQAHTGLLFCDVLCPMIAESRVIVGDVTTINHNVLFELGYAYGLRKSVYLFRNSGQKYEGAPIADEGFYVGEYASAGDLVAHVRRIADDTAQPRRSPFDGIARAEEPGTVAVLVPDHAYHATSIRPAVERIVAANGLSLAKPGSAASALLREYERVSGAQWVIGDLVSDQTVDDRRLNAQTALLLGIAMALGKKTIVLQELPASRPMIDLQGALVRYASVDEIRRLLPQRLDVVESSIVRVLEPSDIDREFVVEEEGRLERNAVSGPADGSDPFEEMARAIEGARSAPTEPLSGRAEPTTPDMRRRRDVEERVRKIVSDLMGVDQARLTAETRIGSLGADELDEVELTMALEDEFELSIPDEDMERLGFNAPYALTPGGPGTDPAQSASIADIVDYIARNK